MGEENDERPVISVIIVSYNTREMTIECLRTVYANLNDIRTEILVVDNNSRDGSADAIRAEFPNVHVIENERNTGFGAANNLAMRQAGGRYFLLLNSDAFLTPGALDSLLACAQSHPNAAVIGPRLSNEDGSLQVSCFRFPSPTRAWLENLWISSLFSHTAPVGDYRRWPHDTERPVDSVIGACMLVRREAFDQTGGFDEAFFMYQEETDWQKTLRERGWIVYFTPEAKVTHLGGASGKDEAARVNAHFFESLDYYECKHHGPMGLVSLRAAMTIGCLVRAAIWGIVMIVIPGRRKVAYSKSRLHSRLFIRQATHWRIGVRSS
jgi:GT2 family glycosyltransferase